jgi:hypothetical protein
MLGEIIRAAEKRAKAAEKKRNLRYDDWKRPEYLVDGLRHLVYLHTDPAILEKKVAGLRKNGKTPRFRAKCKDSSKRYWNGITPERKKERAEISKTNAGQTWEKRDPGERAKLILLLEKSRKEQVEEKYLIRLAFLKSYLTPEGMQTSAIDALFNFSQLVKPLLRKALREGSLVKVRFNYQCVRYYLPEDAAEGFCRAGREKLEAARKRERKMSFRDVLEKNAEERYDLYLGILKGSVLSEGIRARKLYALLPVSQPTSSKFIRKAVERGDLLRVKIRQDEVLYYLRK